MKKYIFIVLLLVLSINTCCAVEIPSALNVPYHNIDIGIKMLPMVLMCYIIIQILSIIGIRLSKLNFKDNVISILLSNTAFYLPIIYLMSSCYYIGVRGIINLIGSFVLTILLGFLKIKIDKKAIKGYDKLKKSQKIMLEIVPILLCEFITCIFIDIDILAWAKPVTRNVFGPTFYTGGIIVLAISISCYIVLKKLINNK